MKITYYVEDGYVGPSRPHYVDIPDDELKQLGEDETIEEYVDEIVQEHFQQYITPYWDKNQINKFK